MVITLSFLSLDIYLKVYLEQIFLVMDEDYGARIVSFFKDEPIVGGYINGFYLIIIGFLFI